MNEQAEAGAVELALTRYEYDPNGGCWLWSGTSNHDGYGVAYIGRRPVRAHRLFYEALVGSIPDGLQIDHLCRVRCCVNPAHMEIVNNRENVLRGVGHTAQNARKTHCSRGHEFTPENTHYRQRDGQLHRYCVICRADSSRKRRRIASEKSGDPAAQGKWKGWAVFLPSDPAPALLFRTQFQAEAWAESHPLESPHIGRNPRPGASL